MKFKFHYPILILFFQIFKFIGKLIPLSFLPFASSILGKLSFLILKSKRETVYENLKIAFPDWDLDKIKKCAIENFKHYAFMLFELFKMDKLIERVEIDGIENFNEKPSIIITGHIGNWELFGQSLGRNGVPIFALAKKSYIDTFTKFLIDLRKKNNVETILRSEKDSPKLLLKAIKEKKVLTFLIDQDTKVDSVFINFFSKPASTPKGPIEIALKKNLPLNFGYLIRKKNFKYYTKIERIDYSFKNLEEVLNLINKKIEDAIRANPTQWVWVHRRWKSQPLP